MFFREQNFQRLEKEEFDLVVVGGGITGAGIARDAAMRGLKVALLEFQDFCSGTSSKSSKMLHGGIRYLEQLHFALVFEASKERRLHSDLLSPHLAQPVPFMIPVYPWSPHGRAAISFGVFLYDMLALFRNHGSRYLSRSTTLAEEDRIEPKGLKGGVVYHDVVMDDVRIGLENVRSAAHHGAVTVNYAQVVSFEKNAEGKVCAAWVKDTRHPAKAEIQVKGKYFVNASGPWSDKIRKMLDPNASTMLRPTKGTHIILPAGVLSRKHGFVLTAKSDDRVFFSIPWFDRTLVGTTDTDYKPEVDGPLEDIRPTQNDVDYLMESVKRTFPEAKVGAADVQSAFAGLRPLVSEAKASNPSAVSREHKIWRDPSGLFTIAGGKYTTYRTMAQQLVDLVMREMGKDFGTEFRSETTGGEALVLDSKQAVGALKDYASVLGLPTVAHLQLRYGARWQRVADLAVDRSELREKIVPGEEDIFAEALYAKESEMAVELEDFFRRRTMLALKGNLRANLGAVEKVGKVFGKTDFSPQDVARWQGLNLK